MAKTSSRAEGKPQTPEEKFAMYGAYPRASSWPERLMWFAAGADPVLLECCPRSDRVKYQGMGGVVWATTLLALIAGSFAFYTVLVPKGDAFDPDTNWITWSFAGFLGILWALVVFNLDRFIVSSTGKGDGTEKVTLGELMNAMPRLIMALILGISIATPLEIEILKPEIDSELMLVQREREREYNEKFERIYEEKAAEIDAAVAKNEEAIASNRETLEKRRAELSEQWTRVEDEAAGKGPSGKVGCGPACQEKKTNLERLTKELDSDRKTLEERSARMVAENAELKAAKEKARADLEAARKENATSAAHMDGLLARIEISHEKGGLVSFFIAGIFLAIEMAPIFFKLMLTKGAYDYLVEYEKKRQIAKVGVMPEGHVYQETRTQWALWRWLGFRGQPTQVFSDRYLGAERALQEERLRLEDEHVLSEKVHEAFRELKGEEIRRSPASFVGRVNGSAGHDRDSA